MLKQQFLINGNELGPISCPWLISLNLPKPLLSFLRKFLTINVFEVVPVGYCFSVNNILYIKCDDVNCIIATPYTLATYYKTALLNKTCINKKGFCYSSDLIHTIGVGIKVSEEAKLKYSISNAMENKLNKYMATWAPLVFENGRIFYHESAFYVFGKGSSYLATREEVINYFLFVDQTYSHAYNTPISFSENTEQERIDFFLKNDIESLKGPLEKEKNFF